MRDLRELLSTLPIPPSDGPPATGEVRLDPELVQVLGGGLPAGHLHVWGGPPGAGKTAFLLEMLHGAAAAGRRVVYATYDLPAATLALRLLSMAAAVPAERLLDGRLEPADAARAARVRGCLERLPFGFLESRGLGVASLEDRVVRMPFRPEVLALDFLEAVVRPVGVDLSQTLREITSFATRLHIAVVGALRSEATARPDAPALDGMRSQADRVGWIASAAPGSERTAEVLRNRYADVLARAVPLTVDAVTGMLRRAGTGSP